VYECDIVKIGIAGPVTLQMLAQHVSSGANLPLGYKFAPMATWVQDLMTRGHQVVLFTLAPDAPAPRCYAGSQLTIHVGRYRAHGRARDFFALERQDLLAAMLADPCDIIHAHWTYEFAWAALDTLRPVLVTAHDAPMQILRFSRDPYRFVRLVMAWHVARRAQFITAVSDHVANHFRGLFRYRGDMRTIPNAITPDLFIQRRHTGGQKIGKALTFATVLCGWGKLKNNATVLQAFQRVRRSLPNARLLMFGNEHAPGEKAEEWARAHGLDGGVQFVGMVPHNRLIERLVSEVDVFVHPSREEACSAAVAEAMALGLAVIGGECAGGVPDMLDYGQAGVLVDVKSPEQMAVAMLRLADARLRDHFSVEAQRSARAKFNSTAVFSAYENAYRDVVESYGRASATVSTSLAR
jgi:glycosyltransferase involved in cell wall biosynthesis